MKKIYFFLFLFLTSCCVSAQQSLEITVLDYILKNKNEFEIDSNEIAVNKFVYTPVSNEYFIAKKGWHKKAILTDNCFSKIDSLKNDSIVNEKTLLKSKYKNVKFISNPKKLSKFYLSIKVNKRFFYCNKIYVLVIFRYSFNFRVKQILFEMQENGEISAIYSESYVR